MKGLAKSAVMAVALVIPILASATPASALSITMIGASGNMAGAVNRGPSYSLYYNLSLIHI